MGINKWGNPLCGQRFGNDPITCLATRETMGVDVSDSGNFFRQNVALCGVRRSSRMPYFFNVCILFEGSLGCEIDQYMDVSDMWMDL